MKDVSSVSKQFRCPSHYCNVCYSTDPKSTKLKSYTCIRCCRTFHDKCLSKEDFIRLGNDHYYVCAKHLESPVDAEKMAFEMRKFKPSKKDKLSEKRRAKQARKSGREETAKGNEKSTPEKQSVKNEGEDSSLK